MAVPSRISVMKRNEFRRKEKQNLAATVPISQSLTEEEQKARNQAIEDLKKLLNVK